MVLLNYFQPLLKEEKILVASSRWGSFFTHPRSNEQVNNAKQHPLNTFWGDLIRKYSKIAIPLLDYIAGERAGFLVFNEGSIA